MKNITKSTSTTQGTKESILALFPFLKEISVYSCRLYKNGECVFRQGEVNNYLYLIVSGTVALTMINSTGKEILLSIRSRGDLLGEMFVFNKNKTEPYSANVIKNQKDDIAQCDLILVPKKNLTNCSNKSFLRYIIEKKEEYAEEHMINIECMTYMIDRRNHYSGIVLLFMYLLKKHKTSNTDRNRIKTIRATHQELANMLGISREATTRTLIRMKQKGIIVPNINRKKMISIDEQRLCQEAKKRHLI